MKVSLIQSELRWKSPGENRACFSELIDKAPESDIFVLPEMFTTGFVTNPASAAEAGGESLEWMKEMSSRKEAAIAGSVAVEEGGNYYNRLYFVKPDGSWTKYDKRHLFSYGGEDREYTCGRERTIVEHKGFRILLQICYDLRFPVWSRSRDDYDVMLYVANWPLSRIGAWEKLIRARAIENQSYVAAVNRVGHDPRTVYGGSSVVIDFLGETVSEAGRKEETIVTTEIDREKLNAFREKFPAWRDADDFELK